MLPVRLIARVRAAVDMARLIVLLNALGVAKHLLPLRVLAKWAGRARPSPDGRSQPAIVGRVLRAGRYVGVPDKDCLQRSLLLFRELSRAGAAPELIVGFRHHGRVQGHAWVTISGALIADEARAIETFVPTLRMASRGGIEPFQQARASS